MRTIFTRFYPLCLILVLISCTKKKEVIQNPTFINFKVQSTFPHDKEAFTQGLIIHNGELYESTGQEGSWIGIVNIKTGMADKKVILDNKYFGEGITILNNKIYQLTWKSKIGFVYDLHTFKKLNEFKYKTEGWGLTHDSTQLIMSDGTSSLYFRDTLSFEIKKELKVTYQGKPVNALNELEYIDGSIYANVWQTHWIAKINPVNGEVSGFLDLSKLVQQAQLLNAKADVLNGIAWHAGTKSMLVTGKYWPYIYVLKIEDPV
ncbi:MAG: glutaminyl-peptide cyclotransferase [Cyclobacteriaceae bacterium]|nr:glutaminyl-peptide cyclotransferase [Cyclobacteriaceae bacterium]